MSSLLNALQTNDTRTINGMLTHSSSLNHCVNLFFQIGAMRGQDKNRVINAFTKAFGESPLTAMKLLFWARDVRGGAGERQIFKDIIQYLANNHREAMSKNIHLVSEYGRWDDMLVFIGTPLEKQALDIIADALNQKHGLVAKWLPRPNASNGKSKKIASIIRKHLRLSNKEYRKLLAENSNTVEQMMCSNNWSSIEYSKLPSKAMSNLMTAFKRHDNERFDNYLQSVKKGESKINAGAIYPYDVIKNLRFGDYDGANVQWNALPNYLEGNKERLLPVVDVSGSMGVYAGNNPNVSCLDVAISLGMYISERNVGPFKDAFITFSSEPTLEVLSGNLKDRYLQLSQASWGMSTNIYGVFKLILEKAVENKVSQDEMPTMILIMSDMEFDDASGGYGSEVWDVNCQILVEEMYVDAGYEMPKIVYWNIQAKTDNYPVKFNETDCALVSGFSPAILTNLLSGKDLTPLSMMLNVINSERYAQIVI